MPEQPSPPPHTPAKDSSKQEAAKPACPVCGGCLEEVRGKLQCTRCRTICETCCEGGRQP